MEYPIFRSQLQTLHGSTESLLYVSKAVDYVSTKILDYARYSNTGIVQIWMSNVLESSQIRTPLPKHTYIPEILRLLQTRFPDTAIEVDVNNVYILVDWS